ncbi:unnamed protein product [Ilex paraguariensis]|uniref:Uncharacterized protein n=1 Tax=Ilex paraguariensis TaxID=185542 RepID=A0ABC8TLM8_9AQUA
MGSIQQQQQGNGGSSNRIVSFDVVANTVVSPSITLTSDDSDHEDQKHQKPGWKNFLSYVGPGFLVSLAYLDPGNLETDLQAGANHGYESLAANLGVTTGKHLAELCKAEYPKYVKYCLWILAEIAVIAADIPEGKSHCKV